MNDIFSALPKPLQKHREMLQKVYSQYLNRPNGNKKQWQEAHQNLPELEEVIAHLDRDTVTLSSPQAQGMNETLCSVLQTFHPWRKGPFQFFDVH